MSVARGYNMDLSQGKDTTRDVFYPLLVHTASSKIHKGYLHVSLPLWDGQTDVADLDGL